MSLRILRRIIDNTVEGCGEFKTSPKDPSFEKLVQCVVAPDDHIWTAAHAADLRSGGIYSGEAAELRVEDTSASKARLIGPICLVTDIDKKRAFFQSKPALQDIFNGPEDADFVMLDLRPDAVEIETSEAPDPLDDLIL